MLFSKNTVRSIGGTLIVTLLASLVVFALKGTILPQERVLKSNISPRTIRINDTIFYYDSTPSMMSHQWDFGDKTLDTQATGFHRYTRPGNYLVRLIAINNKNIAFKDSFYVRVEGNVYSYSQEDSIFRIVAANEAIEGELVQFRVDGYGSDEFYWDFGDNTSQVTTTLSGINHIFNRPGSYTVKLHTRNNKQPALHQILVLSKVDQFDLPPIDTMGAGRGRQESQANNDFQFQLQSLVNSEPQAYKRHYDRILKYVCNQNKISINVNNAPIQLYQYCQNLRFKTNLVIQSVELTYNREGTCVTGANITESAR